MEERVQALKTITEDASSFGSLEVAASVTVLITTTNDVGGDRSVRLCLSVYWMTKMSPYSLILMQLTEDFLSVVDNLLDVSEETLQESQRTANTSAK